MDVISNSPFSQKISDNDDEEIWQNISFMNLIKNDVTAPMKEAEKRKNKRHNELNARHCTVQCIVVWCSAVQCVISCILPGTITTLAYISLQ